MEATELPVVPAEIAHLVTPEQVGVSRAAARERGLRFYLGKPDKHGCPYRYVASGAGVLEMLHRGRERVASGAAAEQCRRYRAANLDAHRAGAREAKRRRYATPEGYAANVVNHARQHADKVGVARRPFHEEQFLAEVAKRTHGIKVALGEAPDIHHCRREIDEGGCHVPGNLCILSRGLHTSWHNAARYAGVHVSRCLLNAVCLGDVVPCPTLPGCFIERELLDRLALEAIKEAPDLLLSPAIAEAAARLRPEPAVAA